MKLKRYISKKYVIGLLLIPIVWVFYLINSFTFFQSDDWAMRYDVLGNNLYVDNYHNTSPDRVETLDNVLSMASRMYMLWGGGFIAYIH